MITLSNGHVLKYVIATGALGFDGKGWLLERLLVRLGFIKPELFTIFVKTLTLHPRKGNYRRWNPLTWLPFSPWSCIRLIHGGAVNKVDLTNKGFVWWCEKVAPKIDFNKQRIVVSIYGTQEELVFMVKRLRSLPIVGIEINTWCPNVGDPTRAAEAVADDVKAARDVSNHPIIVKVSVVQPYMRIAYLLKGIAEAITINSVPWKVVFPGEKSPLWRLQKKVGGGSGAVSGGPAQKFNWGVIKNLAKQGAIPVIASSIMEYSDIECVERLGASAVSFGAAHLPTYPLSENLLTILTNPCKPTKIVVKDMSGE